MKAKACLLAIALVAIVGPGCATDGNVTVLQAPSSALARGSTYALPPIWGIAVGSPAPAIVNEITAGRLETVTETVMSSRGYRLVQDPHEADLIVTYRVITGKRLHANLTGAGGPCEPLCQASDHNLTTSERTQGTLVLDLAERRTGRLVYRATSEKEISSKDASPERLNSILQQMTKSLPL